MSRDTFTFKRFGICQSRCAMKVGTDGVLLGAWAPLDGVRRVLDVGTGTGLVALMAAQRLAGADAAFRVDAVEIDPEAAAQAADNVAASPWAGSVRVVCADFLGYEPDGGGEVRYGVIVSNPPFFIDALRPPDGRRSQARHADTLPFRRLFAHAMRLLAPGGRVCVVIPAGLEGHVTEQAALEGLYPHRLVRVFTKPGKPCRRLLVAFAARLAPCLTEELYVEAEGGGYSAEYRALTGEFYL